MNGTNEVAVYNERGMLVTKPFIFTSNGSIDFYASEQRVTIVETAPVDDRRKSFYFNMTKDEDRNYEINLRFNPSRIIDSVAKAVNTANIVRSWFE